MESIIVLNALIDSIQTVLLPETVIQSVAPHDPVRVKSVPHPWQLVGTGNYAAVFLHPQYPQQVVKVYAPGRPGWANEVAVYQQLGPHPAFSQCWYAAPEFLILKRLQGITLYDCLPRGIPIPPQVIQDIDQALAYARHQGLFPHDIHGRNVMMAEGRGLVVDISDFLHSGNCTAWEDLKRAYHTIYRPVIAPLRLRIPYWLLNAIRKGYRWLRSRT
jgi:hypothetical protein